VLVTSLVLSKGGWGGGETRVSIPLHVNLFPSATKGGGYTGGVFRGERKTSPECDKGEPILVKGKKESITLKIPPNGGVEDCKVGDYLRGGEDSGRLELGGFNGILVKL